MGTKSAVLLIVCACATAAGQDMRENAGRSLFADQKATRVGDAVTILVVETSSANNDAKTTTSRASDISLNASGKFGSSGGGTDIAVGVGTGNAFKGEGGTSRSGSVRAKITARVDSVLGNGNLMIDGVRHIIVNGEEQVIKVSGIVRPSDILSDNSVMSYNIADARIVMEGNGDVTKVQGPGWVSKLLHFLF